MPGFPITLTHPQGGRPTVSGAPSTGSSATSMTFPGPGTLTVFLILAVAAGMTWEPVRPIVYVLLIIILADLLLGHQQTISDTLKQLTGGSA